MRPEKEHPQQRLIVLQLLKKIADDENYSECKVEEVDYGGFNVTSALFAITLAEPGKEDLKFIAKALLTTEEMVPRDSTWPFTAELYFYTTVVGAFKRMEEIHCLPGEHRLIIPKFYASHNEYPNETLILEDLTARGFTSFDRMESMDLQHACKSIELLAKFHALSFACYKEDPEGFQKILEQRLENTYARGITVQAMGPKALANAYEVSSDENRKALEKYFDSNERDRFSHFVNTFCKSNKNMRVLVHGDFKPTNLMYRKRGNQLEMAMLDFQLMTTKNPVIDLVYFLFVGTDEQFRRLFYHQLLDHYYEQLEVALGRLDVDHKEAYPEDAFRKDVEELSMAGLLLGVLWLPLLMGEDSQLTELADASDFIVPPSPFYRERFNGIVNNYREWGLL